MIRRLWSSVRSFNSYITPAHPHQADVLLNGEKVLFGTGETEEAAISSATATLTHRLLAALKAPPKVPRP